MKRFATIQSSVGSEQSFDRLDEQLASTGRDDPYLTVATGEKNDRLC